MTMAHDSFKERLKTRRKDREMTQQSLSKASGVSQSIISALETGERSEQSIEASTLFRIAAALEVSPVWLMAGNGDINTFGSTDLERIVRKLERLTLGQIRAIDSAIDAMLPTR